MGVFPSLGLEAVKGFVLGEDDGFAFDVGGDEGGVDSLRKRMRHLVEVVFSPVNLAADGADAFSPKL